MPKKAERETQLDAQEPDIDEQQPDIDVQQPRIEQAKWLGGHGHRLQPWLDAEVGRARNTARRPTAGYRRAAAAYRRAAATYRASQAARKTRPSSPAVVGCRSRQSA